MVTAFGAGAFVQGREAAGAAALRCALRGACKWQGLPRSTHGMLAARIKLLRALRGPAASRDGCRPPPAGRRAACAGGRGGSGRPCYGLTGTGSGLMRRLNGSQARKRRA